VNRVKKFLKSLRKSGGLITSLVVVAAILPVIMIATLSEDLRLRSMASQDQTLRIWTEPGSAVAKAGKKVTVTIYAEAGSEVQVVPQVEFSFLQVQGIRTEPNTISYDKPFGGRVILGEAEVTIEKPGTWELVIPSNSVFSRLPDLQVITQGTKITAIE